MMRGLLCLWLAGCTLGGTGRPGDGDDDTHGVDQTACGQAMAAAPLAPAGYDFHDGIATASKNTWDAVTLPQPGDNSYPGASYRTLAPDGAGNAHPGCTTAGLMYTPASIPGYACAAREFDFPAGVTEDTSKPI